MWRDPIERGTARRDPDLDALDVVGQAHLLVSEDPVAVAAARDIVRAELALYVGGMGARGKNFYNALACRYGFDYAARRVQNLYLDGRRPRRWRPCPTSSSTASRSSARRGTSERIAAFRDVPRRR